MNISVAAQPMEGALASLAAQSGVQLLFSAQAVQGLVSRPVHGRYAPYAAFAAAIRSAPLSARMVDAHTVVITREEARRREPNPPLRPTTAMAVRPAPQPAPTTQVSDVIVTARLVPLSPLNAKRDDISQTSTLNPADIARHPGGGLVGALAELPGLTAYSDMDLGQSATGEHEFVTIRGLASSYNVHLINGVRAPSADPSSRALSLKTLPSFGIGAVEVNKTPTAEAPGDSIGGVIDIRTPTAFDFSGPALRLTLQGDLNDRALARGFDGLGGGAEAETARRFGPGEAWGVYADVYYDQTRSVGEATEAGSWSPALAAQAGLTDYRQVQGLATDTFKYDFYQEEITRYGANLSLDYRGGDSRAYVRGLYGSYFNRASDSQASVRTGYQPNTGVDAQGRPLDVYGRPVGPGLSGDPAAAPQQKNLNANGEYDAAGRFDPSGVLPGRYFQLRDQKGEMALVQAGGARTFQVAAGDALELTYEASYAYSLQARPNYVEASFYSLPLGDARAAIVFSDPRLPTYAFSSDAARAATFGLATDRLWKFQGSQSASTNATTALKLDVDYRPHEGLLASLKAGVRLESADRREYEHEFTGAGGANYTLPTSYGAAAPYYDPQGPSAAALPGRAFSGFLGGAYPGVFKTFDRNALLALLPARYQNQFAVDPLTGLNTAPNPGAYTADDYDGNTVDSRETVCAGYVQARAQAAALELVGGLRYEYADFAARYWKADGAAGGFVHSGQGRGDLLPSLVAAYRPRADVVYRASIRRGLSRPAYGLLARPAVVTRDTATGEVSGVTLGNPELKPTLSTNYEAAVEIYRPGGGLIELSLYYKTLKNFIYSANVTGGLPGAGDLSSTDAGVIYTQPQNGRSGALSGVELDVRQPLAPVSRLLRGFDLSGDIALQHSTADSGRADHFGRRTALPNAPAVTYSLQLGYRRGPFSGDLTYRYEGLQLLNLTGNDLDNFLQPTRTLNGALTWRWGGKALTLAAENLLDDDTFWKTLGESKRYLGAQDAGGNGSYVETGRRLSAKVAMQW